VSTLGSWLGNTIPDIDHYLLPILGVIGLLALSPTLVRLLKSGVKQRHTREGSRVFVGRDIFGALARAPARGDSPQTVGDPHVGSVLKVAMTA